MSILKDEKIKSALRCPICKSKMDVHQSDNGGKSLFCNGQKKHCYDFSAGGYVNLTSPGQSNGGDSKGAVRARSAFLDLEHYRPIADKICELLEKHCKMGALVIDAGCGEGYYSTAMAEAGFSVAGFDLSKFAVDAAAKRAKRKELDNTFFGAASVFSLPIEDSSANAVVNVFAPCTEEEYGRVLAKDGVLIVVYAGRDHLLGLKRAIYEKTHVNEDRADLPDNMELVDSARLTYTIKVEGNESIKALFAMTPYYWKTSQSDVQKLDGLDSLETEIDIMLSVYKNNA